MARWLLGLALWLALGAVAAPATAQQATPTPPPTAGQGPTTDEVIPPPMPAQTISQVIRNAGYSLTPEEAAYLDADERLTERFVNAVITADLAVDMVNDPQVRQVLMDQLRAVTQLDPAALDVPPPPSLQALHQVGQLRREALQRTARAWLEGLEANDPVWINRGMDAYAQARQAEADWYTMLRQRLLSSANVPATPPAQVPTATPR